MQTKYESGLRPAHLASGPAMAVVGAGSTSGACARATVPEVAVAVAFAVGGLLPVDTAAPVPAPGVAGALGPGTAAAVAPGKGVKTAVPPAVGACGAPETADVGPLDEAAEVLPARGAARVAAACTGLTSDSGVVTVAAAGAMIGAVGVCP